MTTITLEIPDHLATVVHELGDQLSLVLEMGVSRLAPLSTRAYMEAVELLTQAPTPEAIVAFRFSDEIETRIDDLLSRTDDGELSLAEEIELDRFSQLEERLQLVKARALAELKR
ncbi:MAG: hypothetical protein KJ046_16070 [Anaerolineae bacterium]|nr:hypothetical protein [Anaerolineae bacterium]RIK15215.1 MAG: hypothetical protein DCC51_14940 [Anaerolineae bacterium]